MGTKRTDDETTGERTSTGSASKTITANTSMSGTSMMATTDVPANRASQTLTTSITTANNQDIIGMCVKPKNIFVFQESNNRKTLTKGFFIDEYNDI